MEAISEFELSAYRVHMHSELSRSIGQIRNQTQSEINDVVIWSSVAKQALDEKVKDIKFLKAGVFPVPSRKPAKTVFRDEDEVRTILSEAAITKLYWSVLVYLVSRVESALGDILRVLLRADPRRLLISAAGKKIEFRVIVESGNYADLLEQMIATQLHETSYLRPSEQIEYFEKVTGTVIDPKVAADWIEIKATRDILVHNDGVANTIYTTKAAAKSRVPAGVKLPIDASYFTHGALTMKTLVGQVSSLIQAKLKTKKNAPKT